MKIIHKYVLREHAGPLVFALSALTSLMLLNYVAKQLGNLVGKGLPWTVILEFFALSLPFTVAMTLPMAVLVSVLYAFSRLASENEITALKANGVSMGRLLVPVVIAGAILSTSMIAFNDQVLPRTNHRLRTLQGDIARKKPTFAIKEQIINEVAPNRYFLRTIHLNRETNGLREVTIYDLSDPMRRRTIYADSGVMAFSDGGADLELTLYSGFMQEVPKETQSQLQRLYFKVDLIRVAGVANAFSRDSSDTYKSDREMSVCELQAEVSRYERDFFRSLDDYKRADSAFKKDPKGSVVINVISPLSAPGSSKERSRVRSLGRTYCDAMGLLQRVSAKGIRMAGQWRPLPSAVALLAPRPLLAATVQGQQQAPQKQQPQQQPQQSSPQKQPTPPQPAPVPASQQPKPAPKVDTVKAGRDTLKKEGAVDTVQAPPVIEMDPAARMIDSLRRRDEELLRRSTGAPPPDSAAAAAAAAGAVPPNTGNPMIAPSAGGGAMPQPAAMAMETARSQMLTAREQMNQFAVEIQKKFAISMACVIFVLLGAPIALRFPRGGVGLVIGVSLGVFGLYYVGLIAGEALADRAILTPFWAMWSANILFFLVALVLLSRMGRETATSRGGDLSELFEAMKGLFRRRRGGAA
ncbi:MAG: LptF/LptG family permease [Gemmatimonadaceae bacterium]